MREMKDSGVEWIREMPSSWRIMRFKYFFDIIGGNGFKEEYQGEQGGDYPFFKASDINGPTKQVNTAKNYVTKERASEERYNIIPANSILISKIGEALHKNHRKINLVDCIVDNNCEAFVLKTEDSIDYLYYIMLCIDMGWFDNGGTIPSVNNTKLRSFWLPYLPRKTQQKIAQYLDEKCSQIGSVIMKQQAVIEKLKEYKLSIITKSITKGLSHFVDVKSSGVDAIGDIPIHWGCTKLRYLHHGLTDGTHGTFERLESGRLLLSSKNVRDEGLIIGDNESYISEEDYQNIVAKGFPKKKDILLCCIGASIGRCVLYEFDDPIAFQRSVIMIRPGNHVIPEFLLYSMKSKSTIVQEQLLVNQSAQPGLYQGLVSEIYLTVPPLDEQNVIVDFLKCSINKIDIQIKKRTDMILELGNLKKAIIYEVVTGKMKI